MLDIVYGARDTTMNKSSKNSDSYKDYTVAFWWLIINSTEISSAMILWFPIHTRNYKDLLSNHII